KLFPALARRGVHNIVIAADYGGAEPLERTESCEIIRVPVPKHSRRKELHLALAALRTLFRKRRSFDVLFFNGFWDRFGLVLLFAWLFRKRTLLRMTLLGSDDPAAILRHYRGMRYRLWFLRSMDAFIGLSGPMADSYRAAGFPEGRFLQIPNGVDVSIYRPPTDVREREEVRARLGFPEGQTIALYVGGIIERKGIDRLLDAWGQSGLPADEAMLVLLGPTGFDDLDQPAGQTSAFVARLREEIDRKRLNVRFIAEVGDVIPYLQAADFFVMASRAEGFPNVAVEALAVGLPLVLSDMGGIAADVIEHGQEGFVCASNQEMAAAILRLTRDVELRQRMAGAARQRACRAFDIELIADRYLAAFQGVRSA
ncbi:MAG: glycosyltransferase family 4 protein, partial [Chromatiales bacterium]|nr:glycosyltransferase family 4 protein [Chromatiales bacterium]